MPRVLFIGNSYTATNNLPQLLFDLAISAGDSLYFDSYIPGGATLSAHSLNTTTNTKIMQGNWDYLVLQEQSQLPSFPLPQVLAQVFPAVRYLDSLHTVHSPCGETMFYMTWGRKNGDAGVCPNWPPVCTYHGMDSLLRLRYRMLADSNHAVLSPVGSVWRYIRTHHPSIELYQLDESHPSLAGSYAAACSFYAALFRKNPAQASFNSSLPASVAADIRAAAKAVVYDSLLFWNIGKYDLTSAFSYAHTSGFTYQFTNQSQHATGQSWDFGPSADTSLSPVYTFPGAGTYTVTLSTYNACDTAFSQQTINVAASGFDDAATGSGISVFSAGGTIVILHHGITRGTVSLQDVTGKAVVEAPLQPGRTTIQTSGLVAGIYLVRVQAVNTRIVRKLAIHP